MRSFGTRLRLMAGALALTASGWLSAQSSGTVPARVTSQVVDSERVRLAGSARLSELASGDLGVVSGDTALKNMILLLKPSDAQAADLKTLLAAQMNPKSAQYHKWLTPAEYGARFGVAEADVAKVQQWLESNGLTVEQVPASRQMMLVSGTASQLTAAFHTTLHSYQLKSGAHIGNDVDPEIPTALAPVVRGLVSLNDVRRAPAHHNLGTFTLDKKANTVTPKTLAADAQTMLQASTAATGGAKANFTTTISSSTYHIVAPYDFATIYDVKPLWDAGVDGTGQTIAIVSPSDLDVSDVDSFRAQFGLPASKVQKVYVGDNPGITANVDETALDVEWSGAVAKGATIDLVVAGDTATSAGIDLASIYIVNNDLAPIVSLSYGECELLLGDAGNAFYNQLWQQAQAQGQAVLVASGDAGASTCDQGQYFSSLGVTVNGLGSTPYNVSVGGTDFYGTYTSPSSYWSSTNDPTTLASATAYVPEVPWNDSCGNQVLLDALHGLGEYTSDTTTAQLCNAYAYHDAVGGGGGASSCITNTDGTPSGCTGGYAKPAWQTAAGVPNDAVRDMPDVALFAGDGLWGSFYPYCLSSATPDGTCNMSNSADILGAGGTSFATPAFAGILALVNQKAGAPQGNPNGVLYQLAAQQDNSTCSATGTNGSSSCIYHDMQYGSNALPCYYYAGALDCTPPTGTSYAFFGVTNGWNATAGYDLASGLGSVDTSNLVNAWASVASTYTETTTALTLGATSWTYGTAPSAAVSVSATQGTPTGNVSIVAGATTGNSDSPALAALSNGQAAVSLAVMPVGSYAVHAHYAGDTSFAASDSAAQTITVAKAASTLSVAASRNTVSTGQSVLLTMSTVGVGSGDAPTGSLHVVDATSGADLGTYAVAATGTGANAIAYATIPAQSLISGSNSIAISYAGDANYQAAAATQAVTLQTNYALSIATPSLSVTVGAASTTASTVVTAAAANGGTVAYPITLSCGGTLPTGASCGLSSTLLTATAPTATLTVSYDPTQVNANLRKVASGSTPAAPWRGGAILSAATLMLVFGMRRRNAAWLRVVVGMVSLGGIAAGLSACGGSSKPTATVALATSTTSATFGDSVTVQATVTSKGTVSSGTVGLSDTYQGTTQSLGLISIANGSGSYSATALGIGQHSIVGVFSGSATVPAATSTPVSVAVTEQSTVLVTAIDANGYTVTAPVAVSFQ